MVRHRAYNMLQELTDEHDLFALPDRVQQLLDRLASELGLQNVMKVFFPQQIQAILAYPPQQGVQETGRKGATRRIRERPRERHQNHPESPHPSLGKTLRVP